MDTEVAIVVLNWNGADDTIGAVNSLLAQTHKRLSIIVVENGSADDSREKLAIFDKKNNVKIIQNSSNLGFAGGVNTGIRYALNQNFDMVALFNNDAAADQDWLKNLAAASEKHPEAGIVTGLLLHEDGTTIDSTGDYYTTWGIPFPRSRGNRTEQAPESGYVFGASGGASLYKTEVFKKIGLFDENFFAYYEDVDISFRAQLAGYRVLYTNEAIAYHKQGATSKKIPGFTVKQTFKNLPLLYIKNVPARLLIPVGSRFIVLYLLIFGNAVKNGTGKYAFQGWLQSVWFFWKNSIWQRRGIQKQKVVSTKYISSIMFHDLPPEQTGMRKLFRKK